jgi:hypothetical protein
MPQPPDRVADLYTLIDQQGQKIAKARQDRLLSAQQRSERTKAAQTIILACREELRALRIARKEATDCLDLPDAQEASLVRMVEPHEIAADGAPQLHHKFVRYLTAAEARAWLAKQYPEISRLLEANVYGGWKQAALARVHGVDQATISRRISRGKHLLAARAHCPD